MIVIDASALADALLDDGDRGDRARAELDRDDHWSAPAHLTVEVLSVVRGRLFGRKISAQRARDSVTALHEIVVDHVDLDDVIERIWQLRDNVSAYDAGYIAVAESLDCALVTADARLEDVPGVQCAVIVTTG